MTSALDGARAGLGVATARIAAAAHQTANLLTRPAPGAAPAPAPDPVDAAIERTRGAVLYRANLEIIAAEDRRLGQTLDLIG